MFPSKGRGGPLNQGQPMGHLPTSDQRPWVTPQFQSQNNVQGQWHQPQGQWRTPNYNSSNAPHAFNNTAVSMDIRRARSNRRGRPTFGNVAQTPNRMSQKCFNCDKLGHFARQPKRTRITQGQTQLEGEVTLIDWTPEDNYTQTNPVENYARVFTTMIDK